MTPAQDHLYAVPAFVRENPDPSMISRIKRDTEKKEEFLRRPVVPIQPQSGRRASDVLPPIPQDKLVTAEVYAEVGKSAGNPEAMGK